VRKFCKLDETGDSLVCAAMSQMNLSARAYHHILKLAPTVADPIRVLLSDNYFSIILYEKEPGTDRILTVFNAIEAR
jgi:hypothetical protein